MYASIHMCTYVEARGRPMPVSSLLPFGGSYGLNSR